MKTKATETKFKSTLPLTRRLLSSVLCLGAVSLICSSAPAQNLFMSDGLSGYSHDLGSIYKFTPDGAPYTTFASRLPGPLDMAFDSSGNLFVASFSGTDGKILKFTPGGAQSTFALGLNSPYGLAFDSAGNLFVADTGSGTIYEFARHGARTTFASGLNYPAGLAFDGAGNLFVAEQNGGNIIKFTHGGTRSTFASGLRSPFDLAFDSAGNLFVSDWGGSLYKFTPDGVRSTFAELGPPEGLAFDSAGNLFVVDAGTGNIVKFTPDGVQSTFAGAPVDDGPVFLAFQPTQTSTPTPTPTPTPPPTPTATPFPASTPVSMPSVGVSVSGRTTIFADGSTATFIIFASPINPSQVTTVHYAISGGGLSYSLNGVPGQADIPAGASSTTVILQPTSNPAVKAKVTLELTPGSNYILWRPKKATVRVLHCNFRCANG